ncbi:MAG: hypothetical protein AAF355_06700 [Myxococcota bacterium]
MKRPLRLAPPTWMLDGFPLEEWHPHRLYAEKRSLVLLLRHSSATETTDRNTPIRSVDTSKTAFLRLSISLDDRRRPLVRPRGGKHMRSAATNSSIDKVIVMLTQRMWSTGDGARDFIEATQILVRWYVAVSERRTPELVEHRRMSRRLSGIIKELQHSTQFLHVRRSYAETSCTRTDSTNYKKDVLETTLDLHGVQVSPTLQGLPHEQRQPTSVREGCGIRLAVGVILLEHCHPAEVLESVWSDLGSHTEAGKHAERRASSVELFQALFLVLAGQPHLASKKAIRVTQASSDPDQLWAAGRVLSLIDHTPQALTAAQRALSNGVDAQEISSSAQYSAAYSAQLGDRISCIRSTLAVLQNSQKASEIPFYLLANYLIQAGAFEQAVELLTSASMGCPSPQISARLAELFLFKMRLSLARTHASKALELLKRTGTDLSIENQVALARSQLVLSAIAVAEGDRSKGLLRLRDLRKHLSTEEPRQPVELRNIKSTAILWETRALIEAKNAQDAYKLHTAENMEERMVTQLFREWVAGILGKGSPFRSSFRKTFINRVSFGKEKSETPSRDFHQLRQILSEFFEQETVERAWQEGRNSTLALIEQAVLSLGGNYTEHPSLLKEDSLVPCAAEHPRAKVAEMQTQLVCKSMDDVLSDFSQLAKKLPYAPFPRTYGAELRLWRGDYETAAKLFADLWSETGTKWGYIGLGASLVLQGRVPGGLKAFHEGSLKYRYLDHEATYCYRGEAELQRGNSSAALADLEHAAKASPTRAGALFALALARVESGDLEAAKRALRNAGKQAPGLICMVAEECGIRIFPEEASELNELTRAVLRALRGNRATRIYTFFDREGGCRVIRPMNPDHFSKATKELRHFAVELLLGDLLNRHLPECYTPTNPI